MKNISSAIQAIIDADAYHPVTTVTIELTDGATTLYIANRDVTISAQPYTGDLISLPRLVVSAGSGIDHTSIELSNADGSYSTYENNDELDGAVVTISQYFATDESYTSFEGPVLAFEGVVSKPEVVGDRLRMTIMSKGRISDGSIGRLITGRCLNTFRGANCGYTHSATIATGGSYTVGQWVPIVESPVAGQEGLALEAMGLVTIGANQNRVKITRGGADVDTLLLIQETDLANSQVKFNTDVTVQAGDLIEYETCPRDSMRNCARRWQVGGVSAQQERFMGFDYHRESQDVLADPNQGILSRMEDLVGSIIPIAYGERWAQPRIGFVHGARGGSTKSWASWSTSREGPFVVVLLSEGPVDTGIVTPLDDVMLDGWVLRHLPDYADGQDAAVSVSVGSTSPHLLSLLPAWSTDVPSIPGMSGFPNVSFAIIDLPDNYDLSAEVQQVTRKAGIGDDNFSFDFFGGGAAYITTRYWGVRKPDVMVKYKGRKVQTYAYSGGTPTQDTVAYTRNPFWQILDLLIADQRVDEDDIFSADVSEGAIDLGSFIDWAGYADETIDAFDHRGAAITPPRFLSDLYVSGDDRAAALKALLQSCRGSLVEKNGKVGVVADAPLGGKGTATGGSVSSLVDDRRTDNDAHPEVPSWPASGQSGLLTGLKVEILTGAAAGDVREVASNTADTIVPVTDFSAAVSSGDEYAVYARRLTVNNSGDLTLRRDIATHKLKNKILGRFESTAHDGIEATVPVLDTRTDGAGEVHAEKFGLNSDEIDFPALTDYAHVTRESWYRLRKALDTNRIAELKNVNIEGLPLEVGDIVLLTHDTSGISDETWRVERKADRGDATYDLVLRLYREHIYADWPNENFDGLEISSNLVAPHSIPPHVTNLTATAVSEGDNKQPLVKCSYDLPPWPYSGWRVAIEVEQEDGSWVEVTSSTSASASFRGNFRKAYNTRAIFISHVGVRADAPIVTGTSTGSNTSTTLNDTTKSWETNEWTGWSCRITGGTASGEESEIQSNTLNELTVSPAWDVTPDGTSEYSVLVPASTSSVVMPDPTDLGGGIEWIGYHRDAGAVVRVGGTPLAPTGIVRGKADPSFVRHVEIWSSDTEFDGPPTGDPVRTLQVQQTGLFWGAISDKEFVAARPRRLVSAALADPAPSGEWGVLQDLAPGVTTHQDSGIVGGATYEYYVVHLDGSEEGDPSNVAEVTAVGSLPAPTASFESGRWRLNLDADGHRLAEGHRIMKRDHPSDSTKLQFGFWAQFERRVSSTVSLNWRDNTTGGEIGGYGWYQASFPFEPVDDPFFETFWFNQEIDPSVDDVRITVHTPPDPPVHLRWQP